MYRQKRILRTLGTVRAQPHSDLCAGRGSGDGQAGRNVESAGSGPQCPLDPHEDRRIVYRPRQRRRLGLADGSMRVVADDHRLGPRNGCRSMTVRQRDAVTPGPVVQPGGGFADAQDEPAVDPRQANATAASAGQTGHLGPRRRRDPRRQDQPPRRRAGAEIRPRTGHQDNRGRQKAQAPLRAASSWIYRLVDHLAYRSSEWPNGRISCGRWSFRPP